MNVVLASHIVVFSFAIFTLYFLVKHKYAQLLYLYIFSFSLNGFHIYMGTLLIPSKIVAMGFMLSLFTGIPNLPKRIKMFLVFFIFMLMSSSLIGVLYPSAQIESAPVYLKWRLLVQICAYITAIIPLVYVFKIRSYSASKVYSIYCFTVEFATLIGLVHLFYLKMDWAFMSIIRYGDVGSELAAFEYGGSIITRVYGFCGEPKQLAFLILPYVFSQLYMGGIGVYHYSVKYHWICWILSVIIFFCAYSSAALLTFVMGMLFFVPFIWSKILSKRPFTWMLIAFIIISALLWLTIFTNGDNILNDWIAMLMDRSLGRSVSELSTGDRSEQLGFKFWLDHPEFYIFGCGPGQSAFYLGLVHSRGIEPIQSGIVNYLLDFGMVGICFFCTLFVSSIMMMKNSMKQTTPYLVSYGFIFIVVYINNIFFGQPFLFLFYALLLIVYVQSKRCK